jgi:hypothetical protein
VSITAHLQNSRQSVALSTGDHALTTVFSHVATEMPKK